MSNSKAPSHPGEILKQEFMVPMSLAAAQLAPLLGLKELELVLFTRGELRLSKELTAALSEFFGTTQEFWQDIQTTYENYYKSLKG